MQNYEDYKKEFQKLYPDISEDFLKESYDLRIEFWR